MSASKFTIRRKYLSLEKVDSQNPILCGSIIAGNVTSIMIRPSAFISKKVWAVIKLRGLFQLESFCRLFGVSKQAYYKHDENHLLQKAAQEKLSLSYIREVRKKDPGAGGLKLWFRWTSFSKRKQEYCIMPRICLPLIPVSGFLEGYALKETADRDKELKSTKLSVNNNKSTSISINV